MRIDLTPGGAGALDGANRTSSDSPSKTVKRENAASEGDRAELSTDQARIGELASAVTALPDVRQEKVQALSDAIRNGSYDVSAEQTAGAMLAEMLGNAA